MSERNKQPSGHTLIGRWWWRADDYEAVEMAVPASSSECSQTSALFLVPRAPAKEVWIEGLENTFFQKIANADRTEGGVVNLCREIGYLLNSQRIHEQIGQGFQTEEDAYLCKPASLNWILGAVNRFNFLAELALNKDWKKLVDLTGFPVMGGGALSAKIELSRTGEPRIFLEPQSLFDYAQLEFCIGIVFGQTLKRCKNCGALFLVGEGSGKKTSSEYCPDRQGACRTAYSRKLQKLAEEKNKKKKL